MHRRAVWPAASSLPISFSLLNKYFVHESKGPDHVIILHGCALITGFRHFAYVHFRVCPIFLGMVWVLVVRIKKNLIEIKITPDH